MFFTIFSLGGGGKNQPNGPLYFYKYLSLFITDSDEYLNEFIKSKSTNTYLKIILVIYHMDFVVIVIF